MKNFTLSYKLLFLLLTICLLFLHPAWLRAQSYQLPDRGLDSYTTCSGTLYDDGGPTHPYDGSASGGVTLRPGTAGSKLKLTFSVFEVDSVHTIVSVYDGTDRNAPLIGRFYNGRPTVYATGSTGALTVVLTSFGGSLPLQGFAADISCVASVPLPDLAVQLFQASPTRGLAGDNINLSARLTNLSGVHAFGNFRYLLSTDNRVSAEDVELGTANSVIAAGTWVTDRKQLQLPARTVPGTYYLLCAAQLNGGTSGESNEANNVAATPFTVLAPTSTVDLAITAVDYWDPKLLSAGGTISTSTRVQNLGNSLAVASQVGYYLSADAVWSADDKLLGTEEAQVPSTGKSTVVSGSAIIPVSTVPGTYYLLCVADYLDQVIEDEEQNNSFVLPITVVPPSIDLDFDSYWNIGYTQLSAGGNVRVRCYLMNEGSVRLDTATVGYYLSADQVLSADDVLLDQGSAGPLLPSSIYYYYGFIERTLTIPTSIPLGKRYLLLVADHRNQVAESNETNNVLFASVNIVVPDVDLVMSSGRAYNPVVGNRLSSDCGIANKGTTIVYPATVGYYLSTDNQLSTDDMFLGESQGEPMGGGGNQWLGGPPSLTIPGTTVPGTYYLLFVADYLHQVAETNEANNVYAITLQIVKPTPDLALTRNFDVEPVRTAAGTEVQIAYNFANNGSTAVYAPSIGFYLSTDNALSTDDVFVGSNRLFEWNGIFPFSYNYLTSKLPIPRSTVPGQYYILGVADDQNEFAETDETNNVRFAPLEVTAARPDIRLLANPYLSSKQVIAGGQVATESYVYNIGAAPAGVSKVAYYLSADLVLSANDVLLGSTNTVEVRAGYSEIVTGTLKVPAATGSGRYYVLFVADYLNQVDDSNRDNNIGYTTLTVTGQVLANREQTAGYELSVLPVPVAGPTPLQVQLSSRSTRGNATVALYTSMGQVVATHGLALVPNRTNQTTFQTTGLATGVYILRITGPDLNVTRRVVIE
jgi:subtilase family serine protease